MELTKAEMKYAERVCELAKRNAEIDVCFGLNKKATKLFEKMLAICKQAAK